MRVIGVIAVAQSSIPTVLITRSGTSTKKEIINIDVTFMDTLAISQL